MRKKVLLVKPPKRSRFNFRTFSIEVLAAAIKDCAIIVVLDATDLTYDKVIQVIQSEKPDIIGITVMRLVSVPPVSSLIRQLRGNSINTTHMAKIPKITAGSHGESRGTVF